jgi:outer membrane protein OmpA-like peptidoglycan-associated protein
MNKFIKSLIALIIIQCNVFGQGYVFEGFVFESGNRGFLNQAEIVIKDTKTGQVYCKTETNTYGEFKCDIPPIPSMTLTVTKQSYKVLEKVYTSNELKSSEKNFLKLEMTRAPGYLFEITLADKRENENEVVGAISDYQVEVYNNTTRQEVMKMEHRMEPEFKLNLEKGNHYTILIRRENYLAKQMEVYVNVKGCILCFEGISDIQPGVVDNLTASNEYGVLLANVELEKVYGGKSFEIKNVLYDLNSAALNENSKKELDKVINLLKYNPNLTVQLVSHTDSRGSSTANLDLSNERAKIAVKYITEKGGFSNQKIYAVGLGEEYPKNQCKDGVPCKEEEYAINRRTEIKVLNISDQWIFKPLVNIKNEEEFEMKLAAASNGSLETMTGDQLNNMNGHSSDNNAVINFADANTIEDGVKILLFKDKNIHPQHQQIMMDDANIALIKDENGMIYYIANGHATQAEAKSSIANKWSTLCQDAKVVNFKDGKIIE